MCLVKQYSCAWFSLCLCAMRFGCVIGAGQGVGGVWGAVEGMRHRDATTHILRINTVLNAVTKRGPFLGNSLAVIGIRTPPSLLHPHSLLQPCFTRASTPALSSCAPTTTTTLQTKSRPESLSAPPSTRCVRPFRAYSAFVIVAAGVNAMARGGVVGFVLASAFVGATTLYRNTMHA